MEQFKNFASTVLDGDINNSVTSITVIDGSLLPSVGEFRIRIDSEIMMVFSISGNVLTVVRGTPHNSHLDGAAVDHVLTAQGLNAFQSDTISGNTRNFLIAQEKKGRIYLSTDAPYLSMDNGVIIQDFGLQFPLTPPILAGFTWVNQDGATVSDVNGGIFLLKAAESAANLHALVKNAPTIIPFSVTIRCQILRHGIDYSFGGLCLRESGTGKLETMALLHATESVIGTNKWVSATGNAGGRSGTDLGPVYPAPDWLRVYCDHSTFTYSFSNDGYNFRDILTVNNTDNFTVGPNQIGFFVCPNNGSFEVGLYVDHWGVRTFGDS